MTIAITLNAHQSAETVNGKARVLVGATRTDPTVQSVKGEGAAEEHKILWMMTWIGSATVASVAALSQGIHMCPRSPQACHLAPPARSLPLRLAPRDSRNFPCSTTLESHLQTIRQRMTFRMTHTCSNNFPASSQSKSLRRIGRLTPPALRQTTMVTKANLLSTSPVSDRLLQVCFLTPRHT